MFQELSREGVMALDWRSGSATFQLHRLPHQRDILYSYTTTFGHLGTLFVDTMPNDAALINANAWHWSTVHKGAPTPPNWTRKLNPNTHNDLRPSILGQWGRPLSRTQVNISDIRQTEIKVVSLFLRQTSHKHRAYIPQASIPPEPSANIPSLPSFQFVLSK